MACPGRPPDVECRVWVLYRGQCKHGGILCGHEEDAAVGDTMGVGRSGDGYMAGCAELCTCGNFYVVGRVQGIVSRGED